MIGKLKGKIDCVETNHTIIDVNGVGYLVFCSGKTLANLEIASACELLIETHVREDHIHLYGFSNAEEKATFNILLSVKGVGTRMALAILSQLTPNDIAQALYAADVAIFSSVSGVGKKLAARIITELKDKIIAHGTLHITSSPQASPNNLAAQDAISALTNLGINRNEAYNRVQVILKENPAIDVGELIRLALKN